MRFDIPTSEELGWALDGLLTCEAPEAVTCAVMAPTSLMAETAAQAEMDRWFEGHRAQAVAEWESGSWRAESALEEQVRAESEERLRGRMRVSRARRQKRLDRDRQASGADGVAKEFGLEVRSLVGAAMEVQRHVPRRIYGERLWRVAAVIEVHLSRLREGRPWDEVVRESDVLAEMLRRGDLAGVRERCRSGM